MLKQRDLKWNYKVFQMAALFGLYPMDFHFRTGKMVIQNTRKRKFVFGCWICVALWQEIFLSFRAIQFAMTANHSSPMWDYLALMVVFFMGLGCMFIAACLIFAAAPSLTLTVYNEINKLLQTGKVDLQIYQNCEFHFQIF